MPRVRRSRTSRRRRRRRQRRPRARPPTTSRSSARDAHGQGVCPIAHGHGACPRVTRRTRRREGVVRSFCSTNERSSPDRLGTLAAQPPLGPARRRLVTAKRTKRTKRKEQLLVSLVFLAV